MKFCAFADEAGSALSTQIAALKRNGIPYLELRGVNGKNVKDLTVQEAKEIKRTLDGEGISVWSIGSPIGKFSLCEDPSAHYDEMKRILEIAQIVQAERIRMFSFYPPQAMSAQETEKRVMERLAVLCRLTPATVTLCHENEKDIFGQTPQACLAIHKAFPQIRAVFDPANFVQVGVDPLVAWEELRAYVDYMHVKDADETGKNVPAGKGVGQLPSLIRRYLQDGGSVLTLEPHLALFDGFSELERGETPHKAQMSDQEQAFDLAAQAMKRIVAER